MQKKRKLGTEKLSEFFRQFSVLISSGLPVPKALEIMETDETDKRFSIACRDLRLRRIEAPVLYDDLPAPVCLSGDPSNSGTASGRREAAVFHESSDGHQSFSV